MKTNRKVTINDLKIILGLLVLGVTSVGLASMVPISSYYDLIQIFPQIIGILMAGLLTSVAIIFGMIDIDEMRRIDNILKSRYKSKDSIIDKRITNLKNHIILATICFVISVIIMIVATVPFSLVSISGVLKVNITQFLMAFSLFLMFLSIDIFIEIIRAIFVLFEIKASIATEQVKLQ